MKAGAMMEKKDWGKSRVYPDFPDRPRICGPIGSKRVSYFNYIILRSLRRRLGFSARRYREEPIVYPRDCGIYLSIQLHRLLIFWER